MSSASNAIFSKSTNSIWIFGYGSLVHSPGFEVKRRVQGYVRDWRRVWHQGSTDHRGTIDFPGRTVTLQHDPGAITWGVAYELAGNQEQQAKTLKYLEWREKQYDIRERVSVYGTPDQLELLHKPSISLGDATIPSVSGNSATTNSIPENHRSYLEGLEDHTPPLTAPTSLELTHNEPVLTSDYLRLPLGSDSAQSPGCSGSAAASSTTGRSPQAHVKRKEWDGVQPKLTSREADRSDRQHTVTESNSSYVLLLVDVLCYIASPNKSNVNYLGPATPDELALQIARAVGPSGPNWEYVAKLADAMRTMGIPDPELFALERQVAQAMVHLKQQQLGSSLDGMGVESSSTEEEAEEVKERRQMLQEREAQFLAFHTRQSNEIFTERTE